MNYATFWKRGAAYLVDSFIAGIAGFVLQYTVAFLGYAIFPGATTLQKLLQLLLSTAIFLGYYVWPESSSWQGTLGKRIFNLRVADLNGQRLSFLRSLGRNAGKVLSGFILGIGFLFCLWTEKTQCLHDLMAHCVVVDPTPQEKTGCMIAVIIATALFFLGIILVAGIFAFALVSGAPVQ
jgi:uncharacterized RDD family membrane protein YckC